jgi:hypothetical protein
LSFFNKRKEGRKETIFPLSSSLLLHLSSFQKLLLQDTDNKQASHSKNQKRHKAKLAYSPPALFQLL